MANKKKTKVVVDLTRRDILKMVAATAGSIVAAPLLTTGPLSPFGAFKQQQLEGQEQAGHGAVTGEYHWGMVINLDICIGCEYCMRACSATNDVAPDKPWNFVVKDKTSGGHTFFLSRPCLHCQNAPCVEVCPVKATYHRDDGLVVMDYDRCIGCRYCQVACPYDARKFNWDARAEDDNPYTPTWGEPEVERRPRGVVEKCTFCIQRIDAGLAKGLKPGEDYEATPACVNVCPVNARIFGNLKDPASAVSQAVSTNANVRLRDDLGTETSVYYIPPKEGL
ncbi:MAG: 4Fe-4S dicluster domain-containing protein [Chloroflexi bacterium]|nr:MAG: 4Fe-4S dicluster domain-containing protein [Chloroflexota bacterium]